MGVNAVAAGTVVPTASVIAASARNATAPVYTTPNPLHSHPEAAMLMVITPSRASTPRTPRSRKQGAERIRPRAAASRSVPESRPSTPGCKPRPPPRADTARPDRTRGARADGAQRGSQDQGGRARAATGDDP